MSLLNKKNDHDVLLRWRSQLTDLETDTFIPLFKSRLDGFNEIFNKMLETVHDVSNDVVYISAVEKIVNPNKLPTSSNHVTAGMAYCQGIERTIQDFLRRISEVRVDLMAAQDFRQLSKCMSLMDQLCQSIIQNKASLFLFSIRPYAHVIDHKTKSILITEPVEYTMILRPFDLWLLNLEQIAMGTSGTIETWRKTQQDWKTQYLSFRSNESLKQNNTLVLWVNIATVFLAVSVSLVFLFFPDLLGYRKENAELQKQLEKMNGVIVHLEKENTKLKVEKENAGEKHKVFK